MTAPTSDHTGGARPARAMSGGKIALVAIGATAVLIGFLFSIGGGVLVWAHTTQRDAAGYYNTSSERLTTATAALTSRLDLGDVPTEHDWTPAHPAGTVRVAATAGGGTSLFVGIGPESDVDRWLAGVAHEHVTGANFGPFRTRTSIIAGDRAVAPPTGETFWVASATGTGTPTLVWPSEGGRWTIVVMNADGRPGVATDVVVGMKTGALLPIGIGLAAFGVLALAGGIVMMAFGLRGTGADVGRDAATATATIPARAPGTYPARLDGHLDPHLNRWLWLVKWVLIVPHAIVLAFLWLAVAELTFAAGVAILFTGRYPRSIWRFNVGVLRWTWRTGFYSYSALATDRYPPFTLEADPSYPASFDVDYPARLSRGLVLVKWWLLALPHLVIVAVFAGGWGLGWGGPWRLGSGGGLIALLVLVAGVILAVKKAYPESLFDFVMGLNRWCFRVAAYVMLLRDEYPPFRFDDGGIDPGTIGVPPPPPPPATSSSPGELVRTGD